MAWGEVREAGRGQILMFYSLVDLRKECRFFSKYDGKPLEIF